MSYWEDTVKESFEDAGITATDEQIDTVISWVEGAHENYGMATGRDCIPAPRESEVDALKKQYKQEIERLESQIGVFRKSVATRRGVDESDVYLDGNSVIVSCG